MRKKALLRRVIELHEKDLAMGLDSLYHLLKPEFQCSRKHVHRQMQLAGVSAVRRLAYKRTTKLTLAALDMAYHYRRPAKGLIFHSDRDVQYAAIAYREHLEAYGIRQSMSCWDNSCDNAVAENFSSCLKCELIHLYASPFCSRLAVSLKL